MSFNHETIAIRPLASLLSDPDQFGIIHTCALFWTAPATGTDSEAGTIVHEASHFLSNGGTLDKAHGRDGCRDLAKRDPTLAIMNADSHEYIAENNPVEP